MAKTPEDDDVTEDEPVPAEEEPTPEEPTPQEPATKPAPPQEELLRPRAEEFAGPWTHRDP